MTDHRATDAASGPSPGGVIERLARHAARRPSRTISAWVATCLGSFAIAAFLLAPP